jgi:glutathione peroxidase-family protein
MPLAGMLIFVVNVISMCAYKVRLLMMEKLNKELVLS